MFNKAFATLTVTALLSSVAVPVFAMDDDMSNMDGRRMNNAQMHNHNKAYETGSHRSNSTVGTSNNEYNFSMLPYEKTYHYQSSTQAGNDIVDVASSNASTSVLAALIKAAELDEVLDSGQYTVFAPSNKAFGKLPEGTITKLMQPENKAMLRDVLLYHVTDGNITSDQIPSSQAQVNTLNGNTVTAQNMNGIVSINNTAQVASANIAASNGTIHIIDDVLLPPSLMNTQPSTTQYERVEVRYE